MKNKIVARFTDGHVLKGTTIDFATDKKNFHLTVVGEIDPQVVWAKDLKALFFVKDFTGDPAHVEANEFVADPPPVARKIRVKFNDGEVLIGSTTGYKPNRAGFFITPADDSSNIERAYVQLEAVDEIDFL
ncbi:MAG TPA: hypothetical protein VFG89_08910 [Coriobacteriia bacterium]|nr:hypothetical protein [Coriobacteriia bacterium]